MPIILAIYSNNKINKSIVVFLIYQIIILITSYLTTKNNRFGTIWCFLGSFGLWINIIYKYYEDYNTIINY